MPDTVWLFPEWLRRSVPTRAVGLKPVLFMVYFGNLCSPVTSEYYTTSSWGLTINIWHQWVLICCWWDGEAVRLSYQCTFYKCDNKACQKCLAIKIHTFSVEKYHIRRIKHFKYTHRVKGWGQPMYSGASKQHSTWKEVRIDHVLRSRKQHSTGK